MGTCTKLVPITALAARDGAAAAFSSNLADAGPRNGRQCIADCMAVDRYVVCPKGCGAKVIDYHLESHKTKYC